MLITAHNMLRCDIKMEVTHTYKKRSDFQLFALFFQGHGNGNGKPIRGAMLESFDRPMDMPTMGMQMQDCGSGKSDIITFSICRKTRAGNVRLLGQCRREVLIANRGRDGHC